MIKKHCFFLKVPLEGLEVQYGPKIEENSLKMAVLAPRWAPLGDFWVILSHVGGKMATKSARMSQHWRQRPNPRGFEGFTDGPDGREPAGSPGRNAFWLGGVARNPPITFCSEARGFKKRD